jgi:hypothetical protein
MKTKIKLLLHKKIITRWLFQSLIVVDKIILLECLMKATHFNYKHLIYYLWSIRMVCKNMINQEVRKLVLIPYSILLYMVLKNTKKKFSLLPYLTTTDTWIRVESQKLEVVLKPPTSQLLSQLLIHLKNWQLEQLLHLLNNSVN